MGQPHRRKDDTRDYKKELAVILSGFPDARATIADLVAEGDKVASRTTFNGTHTKTYFGLPPTGKRLTLTMLTIDRIANGKIVESWDESTGQGFYYQLTGKRRRS